MLLAEPTILVHLKSVRVILLVFHCVVIALLALCTSKCDFNSHNGTSRFTEIFFAFTLARPKGLTVKVTPPSVIPDEIALLHNILPHRKSTIQYTADTLKTGSFAKKKNLFRGSAIISHTSQKVKSFLHFITYDMFRPR